MTAFHYYLIPCASVVLSGLPASQEAAVLTPRPQVPATTPIVEVVAFHRLQFPLGVSDNSAGATVVTVNDRFIGILDQRVPRVWVFTSSGELARSLTHEDLKGIDASDLLLTNRGEPQVYDPSAGTLWEFTDNTRSAVARVRMAGVRRVGGSWDRMVYLQRSRRLHEAGVDLVAQEGAKIQRMVTGVLGVGHVADFPSCHLRGVTVHPFFEPRMIWSTNGAWTVAMPNDHGSMVVLYRGSELRVSFDLDGISGPLPATREHARTVIGDGWGLVSCRVPPEEALQGRRVYPTMPIVADMLVAPGGEIWVQYFTVGDAGAIEVFTPEGKLRARGHTGGGRPLAIVSDTLAVTLGASDNRRGLWLAHIEMRAARVPRE